MLYLLSKLNEHCPHAANKVLAESLQLLNMKKDETQFFLRYLLDIFL